MLNLLRIEQQRAVPIDHDSNAIRLFRNLTFQNIPVLEQHENLFRRQVVPAYLKASSNGGTKHSYYQKRAQKHSCSTMKTKMG